MALKKGSKVDRGYSTVAECEGINYREIADTMTDLGFPMNHSSACNYVLRVMRKFAEALVTEYDGNTNPSQDRIDSIAKSPAFQQGVADFLLVIEMNRRDQR
jgi:hypothetical protein